MANKKVLTFRLSPETQDKLKELQEHFADFQLTGELTITDVITFAINEAHKNYIG